jgi:peptidoglycan DL-endopeptidase CwlO
MNIKKPSIQLFRNLILTGCLIFSGIVTGRIIEVNDLKAFPVPTTGIAKVKHDQCQPAKNTLSSGTRADSIVAFAKQFIGTPYFYAGKCKATGFDCSGFTSFVYRHFGIEVSTASAEQINSGRQVPMEEAQKGDLLIFTGTHINIRKPGHVGIVISNKGEPIQFIHSSSGPAHGVTISAVNGTKYALRLLQVRRVLE